jgi:hypothetical protein
MIARVSIKLPFILSLPFGEDFTTNEFDYLDYKIHILPPIFNPRFEIKPNKVAPINGLTINGISCFDASVLVCHFCKESFNRTIGSDYDPPIDVIEKVANCFLSRLRYVLKASHIKPIDVSSADLIIEYLNDDETELEAKEGLLRGRFHKNTPFLLTALTKETWNDIHSLPPFQEVPV